MLSVRPKMPTFSFTGEGAAAMSMSARSQTQRDAGQRKKGPLMASFASDDFRFYRRFVHTGCGALRSVALRCGAVRCRAACSVFFAAPFRSIHNQSADVQ